VPEHFVIGNGSTELIHSLPRALSIRHALIIGPAFSEYAKALITSGARVTSLTAERADNYRQPLERAAQLLQNDHKRKCGQQPIDAIVLCNPNSPTGRACAASDVAWLVNAVCHHPVWVIVDETFVEYCKARSVLPSLSDFPRMVVLRSFTKFYALPGLRIGYLVASDEVVRLVLERQPPWSVNWLAQVAAVAALNDRSHVARSLAFMKRERTRLVELFNSWPGVTVFDSEANFLLVELPPGCRAAQVSTALRRHGLLIRDCSSIPGLNDRSIRIAVKTRGENDRLFTALKHLVTRGWHASV
jgi:threonine-phosphate decarboxylase